MNLKSFYGKKGEICDVDGQIFAGIVDDYIFPEDNEDEKESIILKTETGDLVEFPSDTIEKITVH